MKTKKKFKNRTNKGKLLYIRDASITVILYLALIYMLVFLVIAVINFLK